MRPCSMKTIVLPLTSKSQNSPIVAPADSSVVTTTGAGSCPTVHLSSVVAPTVEKEPVAAAEGAAAVEAPAEPEVIKKGKAETAEEGEGEQKKGSEKGTAAGDDPRSG